MNKETIEITDSKFAEIYTSEKFRNEVAHAHGCLDQYSNFKYYSTCSYPVRYIVTKEQIEEAASERAKAKKKAVENVKNRLVFVAMGCDYSPRYQDDVCNHRIRTEFKNKEGQSFFIEVGTGLGDDIRIDFAIDRDLERENERRCNRAINNRNKFTRGTPAYMRANELVKKYQAQPYYNYRNLERAHLGLKYTKQNVLRIVNKYFDCDFKEMFVDEYNLSTEDFICNSPK